jgi:hypothetical protein
VRLVAALALTVTAQLVPLAQLCTTVPAWSTMSMYHTVGQTSVLVVAVRVTLVFTGAEVALALRPVRQVPSLAHALVGVLVVVGRGVLVAVAPASGVFVAVGRGVMVAVAAPPVQLTVTLFECGPPPDRLDGEVLNQAV